MPTPGSTNAKSAGEPARPDLERGAVGSGTTRAVVGGEVAPRLPHERDESSDSGTGAPTEVMQKAAADVRSGQADEPRGPGTQQHYSELTDKAREEAKPV